MMDIEAALTDADAEGQGRTQMKYRVRRQRLTGKLILQRETLGPGFNPDGWIDVQMVALESFDVIDADYLAHLIARVAEFEAKARASFEVRSNAQKKRNKSQGVTQPAPQSAATE